MPSKEQVLIGITKDRYSRAEVQHLINSITHIAADTKSKEDWENERKPRWIKMHDVFTTKDSNEKYRPYVVVKVLEDTVVAMPLSTTEDSLSLCPSRSRFLKDGFFSKQLITVQKGLAEKRWCGVYDNPKLVRKAIRELKKYTQSVL